MSISSRLRTSVLLAGLFAVSPAIPTYARPVGPALDTLSIACGALQDRIGPLVEEYGRPGTSDARAQEILAELRNIGQNWIDIGCKAVFGQITMEVPPRSKAPRVQQSPKSSQSVQQ